MINDNYNQIILNFIEYISIILFLIFTISHCFGFDNDLEIEKYQVGGFGTSNLICYNLKNKQFKIDVEQDTLTGYKYGDFSFLNPLTENDIHLIDRLRKEINISDMIDITFNNSNLYSSGWEKSYEYITKLKKVEYLFIHCSGNTIIPEFLFRKSLTQLSFYISDTINFKDVHTNTALISNIYIMSKTPITIINLDNMSYKGKIINLELHAAINNLDQVVNDLTKIKSIESLSVIYPYESYELYEKYPILPTNIFEINTSACSEADRYPCSRISGRYELPLHDLRRQ